MPFYPLPMPRLLPKPVVATKETTAKQARMDKFTSVERDMLSNFLGTGSRLELGYANGKYGYAQKLVKRGYLKAISHGKHATVYAITPAGERARAGMALLKSVQGKQALTSYNNMRAATA